MLKKIFRNFIRKPLWAIRDLFIKNPAAFLADADHDNIPDVIENMAQETKLLFKRELFTLYDEAARRIQTYPSIWMDKDFLWNKVRDTVAAIALERHVEIERVEQILALLRVTFDKYAPTVERSAGGLLHVEELLKEVRTRVDAAL